MRHRKFSTGKNKVFFPNRTKVLGVFVGALFFIVTARLFQLQVVQGEEFKSLALSQRSSRIEIPARRGEILARDLATGDFVKLATNTTLDLVFVDPLVTPNKRKVAQVLAPLLFSDEDFANCLANFQLCPKGSVQFVQTEQEDLGDGAFDLEKKNEGEPILPSRELAEEFFQKEILEKIQRTEIDFVVLQRGLSDEALDEIENLNLRGVGISKKNQLVWADPTEISKAERKATAKSLATVLQVDRSEILRKISGGPLRWVPLKRRLAPEISERIKQIKVDSRERHRESKRKIFLEKSDADPVPDFFRGVGLIEEHFRYYPDGSLAAQVVGFVNNENVGQYGVEGKFDNILAGKKGVIESQNDVSGMQIGIGADRVEDAENGSSIVLTIDRIVQKKVEEILKNSIEKFKADSGQVIVMEPFSGEIVAMANYPTFDPNFFGQVYRKRRTTAEDFENIFETTPLFQVDENDRFLVSNFEKFKEAWQLEFDPEFYIFKNVSGPAAYLNKAVQAIYEPGSVFKPLAMASALDAGEVTPSTRFNEDGPITVGEFEIHTAMDEYHGWQTMTNALETSSNIGMARVALKLGKSVFYKYIKDFGFGEFTDVGLENELAGTVKFYKQWSNALLITSSFGQGLDATPLQMATAWCVLANGGILMKPHIVKEILKDGKVAQKMNPEKVRHVISPDTSTRIKAMLVSAVDNGVARDAKVEGYRIAGKTGTSQIARTDGVGYEKADEPGHVITSFAGFAPLDRPRFVVLVKFDRPHVPDSLWGSDTAAPTFAKIAKFLLDYYSISPDED